MLEQYLFSDGLNVRLCFLTVIMLLQVLPHMVTGIREHHISNKADGSYCALNVQHNGLGQLRVLELGTLDGWDIWRGGADQVAVQKVLYHPHSDTCQLANWPSKADREQACLMPFMDAGHLQKVSTATTQASNACTVDDMAGP